VNTNHGIVNILGVKIKYFHPRTAPGFFLTSNRGIVNICGVEIKYFSPQDCCRICAMQPWDSKPWDSK
jgi:hypothetical protein